MSTPCIPDDFIATTWSDRGGVLKRRKDERSCARRGENVFSEDDTDTNYAMDNVSIILYV